MRKFNNWCPKKALEYLKDSFEGVSRPIDPEDLEHEAVGPIIVGKTNLDYKLADSWTRIELHVCKHCGCLFAKEFCEEDDTNS